MPIPSRQHALGRCERVGAGPLVIPRSAIFAGQIAVDAIVFGPKLARETSVRA